MKVLILFIFFASLFYYLRPADRPRVVDLDEIRVKISAPRRVEKTHKHRHIANLPVENTEEEVSRVAKDLTDVNTNIENNWEKSLQARLLELDPASGAEIFHSYQLEKDRYARELEKAVKEHQESDELDHLIEELDMNHQQKLQDIFGPYFEDLRDLQS